MTENEKKILTFGGIAAAILFFMTKASASANQINLANKSAAFSLLKNFLQQPEIEGFYPRPYWDYKQWTWGFGTRVPNSVNNKNVVPKGTITISEAWPEAVNELEKKAAILLPQLKVGLNPYQLAAWLSFAYNLGEGNADNLLPEIKRKK